MGDKPTLLISGGSSLTALFERLAESFDLLFIYPPAAQLATEMGVSNAGAVMQYMDGPAQDRAHNLGAVLTARVVNAMPRISETFKARLGPNPPHTLNGYLGEWWMGFAADRLVGQAGVIVTLEKAFAARNPVGLVVHEDVTPDMRTVVGFCKARGIPTIHIPHAACHLLPGVRDIHRETRADYVGASGPYMAEFYHSAGMPLDQIEQVGVPSWDGYYSADLPGKDESKAVLSLAGRVVTYASTWAQTTSLRSGFLPELTEGLNATIDLAKRWDASLIIKMHPNQSPQDEAGYAEAMKAAGVGGLVTRNHINYCIRATDLLIAQGPSNLCIEAAIMGVPSVYLQTEGFDYAYALPYRATVETLEKEARAALDSAGAAQWQDFIAHYNIVHPNGGAIERAGEFVERVCQR